MEVDALEANFPQLKMRTVYYNSSQVLLISTEQFVEIFVEIQAVYSVSDSNNTVLTSLENI